jgi:large subunit ribosomal protein L22
MEQYKAVTKFIRISPRKARLAADLIRGLPIREARLQLDFSRMKAGRILIKTLNSAVSNAEMRSDLAADQMIVKECRVDEGPRWKRAKPRSRGSSHPFLKRTAHFIVVVGANPQLVEEKKTKKRKKTAQKVKTASQQKEEKQEGKGE